MTIAVFVSAYAIWRVVVQCAYIGLFLFVVSRVHGFFETSVVSGIAFLCARTNELNLRFALQDHFLLLRLKAAGLAVDRGLGENIESIATKELALQWIDRLGGWALQAIAVLAVVSSSLP